MLCKSIKAYYCDFSLTWLVQCDDLPKSLKALVDQNGEIGDGDSKDAEFQTRVNALEPYKERFGIIRDKKTKLQKVLDLLTLYLADVLDSGTVSYFKESFMLKKLENASSKTTSPETSKSEDIKESRPSVGDNSRKSLQSIDLLDTEEKDSSIAGLSLDRSNTSEVFEDDTKPKPINESKPIDKSNENQMTEIKMLKDLIDEFEKQRVSAPNPFYFHCIVKEYLENSKGIDDELTSKLQELITRTVSKCGMNQD